MTGFLIEISDVVTMIMPAIWLIFIILALYTMALLIKASKIYIKKNVEIVKEKDIKQEKELDKEKEKAQEKEPD